MNMEKYDLKHLTQPLNQVVFGPIQDDEALFLYSIIKSLRFKRIIEIGGGTMGYSGKNFSKSVGDCGVVYIVDIIDVPITEKNQILIKKNASLVSPEDFDNSPVDMVFFDCHVYEPSMACYQTLLKGGIITDKTIIALHDTNLLPDGTVHQPVERMMVNDFSDMGYHIFNLHTTPEVHDSELPFRLGVSICQKYKRL